jgi:competence protein ComEC
LTGDTPTGVEEYLLVTDGDNLDSDVLKVAHHGSKNSASVAFMGVVSPEYAVISSGAGNSYGHPHKEILDELDQFGVKILRTDELGTVRLVSDGEKFTVE